MGPSHLCTAHLCLFLDIGILKINPISSHFITLYMCLLSNIKPLKPDCSMNAGINEASFQRIYVHILPPAPFVPQRMRALCHSPECTQAGDSSRVIPAESCQPRAAPWGAAGGQRGSHHAKQVKAKTGTVRTVQANYRITMAHIHIQCIKKKKCCSNAEI